MQLQGPWKVLFGTVMIARRFHVVGCPGLSVFSQNQFCDLVLHSFCGYFKFLTGIFSAEIRVILQLHDNSYYNSYNGEVVRLNQLSPLLDKDVPEKVTHYEIQNLKGLRRFFQFKSLVRSTRSQSEMISRLRQLVNGRKSLYTFRTLCFPRSFPSLKEKGRFPPKQMQSKPRLTFEYSFQSQVCCQFLR